MNTVRKTTKTGVRRTVASRTSGGFQGEARGPGLPRGTDGRYALRMRIYPRPGDDGSTGFFGGARTSKGAPRVEAYGAVDECNAAIGLARAAGAPPPVDRVLSSVQASL